MSSDPKVEENEETPPKPSLSIDSETNKEENSNADGTKVIHDEEPNSTTPKIEEPCPPNEELEKLFADRYTEQNASYAEICKGFPPVIIVHPWAARTKRVFDYTRGRGDYRGGWRGGRDNNWRGGNRGGRGNWRGGEDRGNWRGGGGGGGNWRGGGDGRKRNWDNNGDRCRNDREGGSEQRVHYPGRH